MQLRIINRVYGRVHQYREDLKGDQIVTDSLKEQLCVKSDENFNLSQQSDSCDAIIKLKNDVIKDQEKEIHGLNRTVFVAKAERDVFLIAVAAAAVKLFIIK